MVLGIENRHDVIAKDNQILLDSVRQEKNAETNLTIENVEGKGTEKIILEELIDLKQDNMVLGIENRRDVIAKDNQILVDSVGQEKNAVLNETKDNTYESIDGLKKQLRDSHKEIADISNQM